MTKLLIIKSDKVKIGFAQTLTSLKNMVEGACNSDGTFKQGWQPHGQWYVRKEGVGRYVVVHNQNRIDYGVSAFLIKEEGIIDIISMGDISFILETRREKELIDLPFRFTMSFVS